MDLKARLLTRHLRTSEGGASVCADFQDLLRHTSKYAVSLNRTFVHCQFIQQWEISLLSKV